MPVRKRMIKIPPTKITAGDIDRPEGRYTIEVPGVQKEVTEKISWREKIRDWWEKRRRKKQK